MIRTKAQMYSLLLGGRFGNFVRAWDTLPEVLSSGYRGLVSLRSRERSNPIRLYHIPIDDLEATVAKQTDAQRAAGFVFSEAPPDHKRTIQGELMRDEAGYYLHYSFSPEPMRIALEQDGQHARGLAAKLLLEHYLEPSDYDALQDLLDAHPGAVIEFTGFTVPVGVIPHRKMVVWEVRNY